MVNALLLRVHQSGHLAEITDVQKELVKEALDYYKTIRDDIKQHIHTGRWELPIMMITGLLWR